MEPNPERARFYQDYIPFTRYDKYQVSPDYQERFKTPEDLEIARNNFIIDNYPDNDTFTPEDWEKRLMGVDKTKQFEYINAFQPEYDEKECSIIQSVKDRLCKKELSGGRCTSKDRDEVLKKKHDDKMKCRNIRAIESFSNCRNIEYERWIKSNGIQHTKEMNQLARGAYACADIHNRRKNSSSRRRKNKGKGKSKSKSKRYRR